MSLYYRDTEDSPEIDDALACCVGRRRQPKGEATGSPLPAQPVHDPARTHAQWDGAQWVDRERFRLRRRRIPDARASPAPGPSMLLACWRRFAPTWIALPDDDEMREAWELRAVLPSAMRTGSRPPRWPRVPNGPSMSMRCLLLPEQGWRRERRGYGTTRRRNWRISWARLHGSHRNFPCVGCVSTRGLSRLFHVPPPASPIRRKPARPLGLTALVWHGVGRQSATERPTPAFASAASISARSDAISSIRLMRLSVHLLALCFQFAEHISREQFATPPPTPARLRSFAQFISLHGSIPQSHEDLAMGCVSVTSDMPAVIVDDFPTYPFRLPVAASTRGVKPLSAHSRVTRGMRGP